MVEKGRKKREKIVEASGAAKDIRNSGGDELDKKWGVGGFACVNEGRGSEFTLARRYVVLQRKGV